MPKILSFPHINSMQIRNEIFYILLFLSTKFSGIQGLFSRMGLVATIWTAQVLPSFSLFKLSSMITSNYSAL